MQIKPALAALSTGIALFFTQTASAMICPFTDNFFISAPLPLRVLNASTEGNLAFTQMYPSYFRLSCQNMRVLSGGVLTVAVGMTDQIKCTLKIEDGPYKSNPNISQVSCGGPASRIYFVGMDHPTGTYDYYLKFTM